MIILFCVCLVVLIFIKDNTTVQRILAALHSSITEYQIHTGYPLGSDTVLINSRGSQSGPALGRLRPDRLIDNSEARLEAESGE